MRAVVTAEEMYKYENAARTSGAISVDEMMERVATDVADAVCSLISSFATAPFIILLLGRGNNGIDGSIAGTFLVKKGFTLFYCQVEDSSEYTESIILQKRKNELLAHGGKEVDINSLSIMFPEEQPLIIIDAIYGVGFKGVPSLSARKAIEWANQSIFPKIAIDIPSGLNPNTGEVVINAVRADITVTRQFPKKGFFFRSGWEHVGKIILADLGIHDCYPHAYMFIEEKDIARLLPTYLRSQNKLSRGHCIAIGGSTGLVGAYDLTLQAALTTGIGYLSALIRHDIQDSIYKLPIEAVKKIIPQELLESSLSLQKIVLKGDAVIIGPGMGRDQNAFKLFKEVWDISSLPRVLDADALFFLSQEEIYPNSLNNAVLTPHIGEALRLLGDRKEHDHNIEAMLEALREKYLKYSPNGIVLLKGAPTFLMYGREETIYIIAGGDPGMATLGSGDVLAGTIGSLLAQLKDPFTATILGVGIHALAGTIAAENFTAYSVHASRIIASIPLAFKRLLKMITYGTFRNYMPASRTECSSIENNL